METYLDVQTQTTTVDQYIDIVPNNKFLECYIVLCVIYIVDGATLPSWI